MGTKTAMTRTSMTFAVSLALSLMHASLTAVPAAAQQTAPSSVVLPTDRTVLPIPEPEYPHITVLNARNATPPPRFEVKAPAGNRAIYQDGWLAGTVHRAAWEFKPRT